MKSCWHLKRENETTMGLLGSLSQEIRKKQIRTHMKTISVGERVSCMVIEVKGCLGMLGC